MDNNENFILLASIPKSGTNLFRVAFFNYIALLHGDLEPKTYDDLVAAFPNQCGDFIRNQMREPDRRYLPEGYRDFVYGHSPSQIAKMNGPIVGLYRNPLDYLISAYFYFYNIRLTAEKKDHPRDIINERIHMFSRSYAVLRNIERKGRATLISYEEMVEHPESALGKAAKHFNIPAKEDLLKLAAEHSSIQRARRFEDKNGFMHARDREKTIKSLQPGARFVRDGRIGQWREWFTEDDVGIIKKKLREYGIDPNIFSYLPSSERAEGDSVIDERAEQ